ncbi:MAG: squalene/phytoene synthase family protein [Methylocystaceae bacterium]|nr:squalene/phytoene synthase family protein [Methylocystaceae bacterium]
MTHACKTDFDYVEDIVKNSKSSFSLGMKALPHGRRGYLYAIYAYCRVLDDIADGDGLAQDKVKQLTLWREKIDLMLNGQPGCEITRILADAVALYDIPTQELYRLIDGMEADANGPIQKPTWEELYTYCRCVAVSVGLLSLPIFGRTDPQAQSFAKELGFALQLTNILRDIEEDRTINRIYLPKESMGTHGVEDVSSPNLHLVLKEIAEKAKEHYRQAEQIIQSCGSENLKPALMMKAVYGSLFQKMEARGWHKTSPRIRLSTIEKAMAVMKQMAHI